MKSYSHIVSEFHELIKVITSSATLFTGPANNYERELEGEAVKSEQGMTNVTDVTPIGNLNCERNNKNSIEVLELTVNTKYLECGEWVLPNDNQIRSTNKYWNVPERVFQSFDPKESGNTPEKQNRISWLQLVQNSQIYKDKSDHGRVSRQNDILVIGNDSTVANKYLNHPNENQNY